jgi:RNA polymerase sigma-70 factor (ECF subfamily)
LDVDPHRPPAPQTRSAASPFHAAAEDSASPDDPHAPAAGDEAIGTSPEDVAMNAYADGDDRALNVVYDALAPRLFGFFLRRARNREVAEDLLQRTFLQIHRHRANFLRGAAVAPWAFAIGRRLFLDHIRDRGTERRRLGDRDDDGLEFLTSGSDPEAVASAREEAAHFLKRLELLPENQRIAFELVRIDGLSMAEAADFLGASISATKVRCHRAYKALGLLDGALRGEAPENADDGGKADR